MEDMHNDSLHDSVGTYYFQAPECFLNEGKGFCGKPADVWSLGVTFFAFTFKELPFKGDFLEELLDNITKKE